MLDLEDGIVGKISRSRSAMMGVFCCLTNLRAPCIIRSMKTYMTDRTKFRDNGSFYTPYQQDADDIAYRKSHRMSSTAKLVFIIVWLILVVIFA